MNYSTERHKKYTHPLSSDAVHLSLFTPKSPLGDLGVVVRSYPCSLSTLVCENMGYIFHLISSVVYGMYGIKKHGKNRTVKRLLINK